MSDSTRKILIIEDNSGDVALIREMLSDVERNYTFKETDRLSSGLKLLEEEAFDVVLLDLGLPDSSGIDTFRKIQAEKRELPVIVLTGLADEELAAQAIGAGAQDYLVKGQIDSNLLVRSMRYAIERKRAEEALRHMARHDALTGLPNRRFFIDIVPIALAETRRHERKMSILFLDLDRFKAVNDTLGHEAGDELLKGVAERLKTIVRQSDTVVRIGGDEFNIILADIARVEDIADIARKIVESFRKPFPVAGHELQITTSIGISIYPDDSKDIDTLFKYADMAMYHAKESGRNAYEFFNPELNNRIMERTKLEGMLRRAIELEELVIYYQPQIDINTKEIVCAEALVRWNHPEMGLLEPKRFIPAAEETGFITAIDEWVLRTACAQGKSWLDAGLPSLCVTVNLSARQFQSPELAATVSHILKETGMPPDCLDIEITESMAMRNVEHTVARLRELAGMGIHISIDDFGTGYSSLTYLKRLPIERLKIDRSFIRDIATDADDRAIINAVTAMAHTMKMKVIAEGVETEDQLSFLHSTECDEAQGYLFSRPLPAEEFRELMAAGR